MKRTLYRISTLLHLAKIYCLIIYLTFKLLLDKNQAISAKFSAHYATIKGIVLNTGTEHELRRPFEIFINSKNLEHFLWVVALTRVISAVFQKGGDITFLAEELKVIFDPHGGYFKKDGVLCLPWSPNWGSQSKRI